MITYDNPSRRWPLPMPPSLEDIAAPSKVRLESSLEFRGERDVFWTGGTYFGKGEHREGDASESAKCLVSPTLSAVGCKVI